MNLGNLPNEELNNASKLGSQANDTLNNSIKDGLEDKTVNSLEPNSANHLPNNHNQDLENNEDSSTKKLVKGIGRGAAAYATRGESLKYDQAITNNSKVDQVIGVVSDVLENDKITSTIAAGLDEAGITDTANDAMDLAGDVLNGDIGGSIESVEKVADDLVKINSKVVKFYVSIIASAVLFFIAIFVVVLGPVLGGFIQLTDSYTNDDSGSWYSSNLPNQPDIDDLVSETPDFDKLSRERQAIIVAAASLVDYPYNYGGHPNGPGLGGVPSVGLDCAGYVQWVLWTALGTNPGRLTTEVISNQIGTKFIQIDKSELKPGDIGLKRTGGSVEGSNNHTGIYGGNNLWYHAESSLTGIVKNNYGNFTIYLRYVGVS